MVSVLRLLLQRRLCVYEAGGMTTFRGIIIGIIMANAINKAVIVKFRYMEEFIKGLLGNVLPTDYIYNILMHKIFNIS